MHRDSPRVCDGGDLMLDDFFSLVEGARLDLARLLMRDPNASASSSSFIGKLGEAVRHSRLQCEYCD